MEWRKEPSWILGAKKKKRQKQKHKISQGNSLANPSAFCLHEHEIALGGRADYSWQTHAHKRGPVGAKTSPSILQAMYPGWSRHQG